MLTCLIHSWQLFIFINNPLWLEMMEPDLFYMLSLALFHNNEIFCIFNH